MKTWILMIILFGGLIGIGDSYDDTEWYLYQNFDIPLGPNFDKYDGSYENHSGEQAFEDTIDDTGVKDETDAMNDEVENQNDYETEPNVEMDENNDEDGESENIEELKNKKKKPVKKTISVNKKSKKTKSLEKVNPEPDITQSDLYVAPEDVEYILTRDKRSAGDKPFDYSTAYQQFVRDNFGDDSARVLQSGNDDEESGESGESGENSGESGEEGEAEGYDEEVDGDVEEGSDENESAESDNNYQHVKYESDKAAAESKKHPKHCKIVHKDGQQCSICKNPKTHDESETCSYSSSPPPKRYAFKKKSNHGYDDNEDDEEENPKEYVSRHKKNKSKKDKGSEERKYSHKHNKKPKRKSKKSKKHHKDKTAESSYISPNYWGYYGDHDRKTKTPLRMHNIYNQDMVYHASEPLAAKFDTNEEASSVDKVLKSFKSRDWSNCEEKKFEGFTCYYCKQPDGGTGEECMFVQDEDTTRTAEPKSDDLSSFDSFDSFNEPPPNNNRRQLNRDQNFKSSPFLNNFGQQPIRRSLDVSTEDMPIKTLEYREPQESRALKRMISINMKEEKESPSKSLFYSKIMKI